MTEDFLKLRSLVNTIHAVDGDDWDALSKLFTPFQAKRKEILTRPGEVEKYIYFVVEGVQHVYYLDDQDREATLVFMYSPSFAGVLDSLLTQKPSRYYFETLTSSTFLRASSAALLELSTRRMALAQMVQRGVTGALSGVFERMVELQAFSAEDRFRNLLKRSPHILQLVPHKYLASYIGVDATNFSKMINKIRI